MTILSITKLICPEPDCGAPIQATTKVWWDVDEHGAVEIYGHGYDEPQIYCKEDHQITEGPIYEMVSRVLAEQKLGWSDDL